MSVCQICKRGPAKLVSFKSHRGFLLFRQESRYEGLLCRDHALMALVKARGQTLAGMWFSPGALIFGAGRLLLDADAESQLPPEVVDAPWVPHKVACPGCHREVFDTAGPSACEACGEALTILSCHHCGTVHVKAGRDQPDGVSISSCRSCGKSSDAPKPARNWPVMLLAQAVAEVCAEVAIADSRVAASERDAFVHVLDEKFPFLSATNTELLAHFDASLKAGTTASIQSIKENCRPEVIQLILTLAIAIAEADGAVHDAEVDAVKGIARRFGLDLDDDIEQRLAPSIEGSGDWRSFFGLEDSCTLEELRCAYVAMARQFHPDVWVHASAEQRSFAQAHMTQANLAYERGCAHFDAQRDPDRAGDMDDVEITPVDARQFLSEVEAVARKLDEFDDEAAEDWTMDLRLMRAQFAMWLMTARARLRKEGHLLPKADLAWAIIVSDTAGEFLARAELLASGSLDPERARAEIATLFRAQCEAAERIHGASFATVLQREGRPIDGGDARYSGGPI